MDLNHIKSIIENRCNINLYSPLVLGVSGGPDSLFLLDVLCQLGFKVAVAHFNHQLRNESGEEAKIVELMAEQRNCKFILGEIDVKEEAFRNKRSIEEQARISRYAFLFHTAEELNAQAVAVAHTADDQVETVLMHFLRGTGLNGLAGMPFRAEDHGWSSAKPLVRPLLGTWRTEIEEYCRKKDLNPIRDQSNFDTKFFRNRIRNDLIPLLEEFNPKLRLHIFNLSQIVQEDIKDRKRYLAEDWVGVLEDGDENNLELNRTKFLTLELSSQRQIIRYVYFRLKPELRDLDFASIERIINFLVNPRSNRILEWVAGIQVLETKESIIFYLGKQLPSDHHSPQMIEPSMKWNLDPPFSLLNGWVIKGEMIAHRNENMGLNELCNPEHAWLDAERITFPLIIRRWKKGDRIQPFGMENKTVKLSDFWINSDIARNARQYYPLVCSNKDILWIPGLRTSELFRINNTTQKVLHLQLIQENR